jgi:ribosomal protein L29
MGQEMEVAAKSGKSLKQELKDLKAQIASGGLDGK